jgi:hypothetical protein
VRRARRPLRPLVAQSFIVDPQHELYSFSPCAKLPRAGASDEFHEDPFMDGPPWPRLGARARSGETPNLRRPLLAIAAALLALGTAWVLWTRPSGEAALLPLPEAQVSLLAVGDTGEPPSRLPLDPQLRVGRAMALVHAARPVDALVLLGDNFYPRGLASHELVERVRGNLVKPYCAFVVLRGPRSREVADACPSGIAPTRSVPIFAVLGNHDYETPESAELERDAVPSFVSNWSVPAGVAEVHELPGGVSLVLAQSEELLGSADVAPLRDVLARSRGPWRIVALHRPVAEGITGGTKSDAKTEAFTARVRGAIAESGVAVQLLLSGHDHNLQVFEGTSPGPYLVVVAGSGGGDRDTEFTATSRRFALVRIGFARIDLVGTGADARLVASQFALRTPWLPGHDAPELVSRWSVGLSGGLRDELAGAP